MSNLHDLINLLKDEVDQQQSTYVYYNKQTGIIHKICGSINDDPLEDEEILKVDHKVAEPILSGEKRTNDFIVKYDIAAKQKVLKEKILEKTCFFPPRRTGPNEGPYKFLVRSAWAP